MQSPPGFLREAMRSKGELTRLRRRWRASPILFGVIIAERFGTDRAFAVLAGQIFHTVCGSVLQGILAQRYDIAALVRIVIQNGPWDRTELLAHPEHAARAQNGEHDVVRHLVENDILD